MRYEVFRATYLPITIELSSDNINLHEDGETQILTILKPFSCVYFPTGQGMIVYFYILYIITYRK